MEEARFYVGKHEVIIERFGKNDFAVYFVEADFSVRGTMAEVISEIADTYADCINDISDFIE